MVEALAEIVPALRTDNPADRNPDHIISRVQPTPELPRVSLEVNAHG